MKFCSATTALLSTAIFLPEALAFTLTPGRHRSPAPARHLVVDFVSTNSEQKPLCSLSSSSSTRLYADKSPEPLAIEGDWNAFLDEEGTGLVYYFNAATGESLWEPPTETFPEVNLRGSMRRKARAKQREYIKATALQEQEEPKKKGFLASMLEDDSSAAATEAVAEATTAEAAAAAAAAEEQDKKEQEDWFGFLFEYRNARQKEEETVTVEEEPKENFAGGFLNNLFTKEATEPSFAAPALEVEEEEEYVEEPVAEPIKLEMSSFVLPHPAKVRWGGEDAVFVKGRTFGVMDGVSGADKVDGVPLYSKTLAKELKQLVGEDSLDVRALANKLGVAAETADQTATGASTAILASVSPDGFLRVLNVGDSTCIVVRDGKVAGKSREISHYFECPYQLSADSPDRPRDGTKVNLELLQGDVILMASDGVFDNMTDEEVAELIGPNPKQPSVIAKRVCEQARKVSVNKQSKTPYAKTAQRFGDPDYSDGLGGKVDDVSCVVVRYG